MTHVYEVTRKYGVSFWARHEDVAAILRSEGSRGTGVRRIPVAVGMVVATLGAPDMTIRHVCALCGASRSPHTHTAIGAPEGPVS